MARKTQTTGGKEFSPAQTRGGGIPTQGRNDGGEWNRDSTSPKPTIKNFNLQHSPPPNLCLQGPRSALGYTARRCSEAGPARVVRVRRKTSSSGSAENGFPPATRGKREGSRTGRPLLRPERARRACLCGTHGGRQDGFAGLFSPSVKTECPAAAMRRVGGNLVRPCLAEPDEHHPARPRQRNRSRG